MWQVWNPQDSSPFRSTDYEPEAIYVVPVPQPLGTLPGDWRWRMVQTGIAHQSNGQSDPLSRSWNRAYLMAGFEHGNRLNLQLRLWKRLPEDRAKDNNPDLVRHLGREGGAVVVLFDRDGADSLLRTHDMFDRGEILPRQTAMCDDHDSDHAPRPCTNPGAPPARRSSSRCLLDTCQPASASALAIFSATATDRCCPPVQPKPIDRCALPSSRCAGSSINSRSRNRRKKSSNRGSARTNAITPASRPSGTRAVPDPWSSRSDTVAGTFLRLPARSTRPCRR